MHWAFLVAAGIAAVTAYVVTAGCRVVAPMWGLVDAPDGGRKRHDRATPLMGGVAVFTTFVVGAVAVSYWPGHPVDFTPHIGPLLISGMMFCGLGLWDDRFDMRPRTKFVGQILATLPYALLGPSVEVLSAFDGAWQLGLLAVPFTVFWLVACSNIVNLMDGLDGLASGVGLFAALTLGVTAGMRGDQSTLLLSLLLVGALTGFLGHNWPPAKIFLGDAGSLTVGFLVGALAIETAGKRAAGFALIVPVVLLAVPIFDTSMAIFRRKLRGRGIGEADRGHLHHRLQDRGLTRTQTLLSILGLCAAVCGAAIASRLFDNDLLAVGLTTGVMASLVVARVFGDREANLLVRHLIAAGDAFHRSGQGLRNQIQIIRLSEDLRDEGESLERSWLKLAERLHKLGVTEARASVRTGDGVRREFEDPAVGQDKDDPPHWSLTLTPPGPAALRLFISGHHARPSLDSVLVAAEWFAAATAEATPEPATLPMTVPERRAA